jgi:hypothetical protein
MTLDGTPLVQARSCSFEAASGVIDMQHERTGRPGNEPKVIEQASPKPQPPTEKEKQQIADARRRGQKDQEELRSHGFGDHKGVEGF